jgi:hypothetical protein
LIDSVFRGEDMSRGKREHTNKYETAQRGPKPKKHTSSQPISTAPARIIVEEPQSPADYSQRPQKKSSIDDRAEITTPYDFKSRIKVLGPRTDHFSGGADLVLYEQKQRICLVVGTWYGPQDVKAFRRQLTDELGSPTEHTRKHDLSVDMVLAYSCTPETLMPGFVDLSHEQVVTQIPGARLVNILVAHKHQYAEGATLANAVTYHLARLKQGFFENEQDLDCSPAETRPPRSEKPGRRGSGRVDRYTYEWDFTR